MKKIIFFTLVFLTTLSCDAKHIIGGEMIYTYMGPGANGTNRYLITLKLFRDQNSPPDAAQMPVNVFIGIFNNDTKAQFPSASGYYDVPRTDENDVTVNPFPICITNPPSLNYHVGIFYLTVDLPANSKGYTATYQTCCRISPLTNVDTNGGTGTGSTYSCSIPAVIDNSPQFTTSIDAICGNKPFHLQFSATDADGDSLIYQFAYAYDGGNFQNSQNANPAAPPYNSVPYINSFSYDQPLGPQATINRHTGEISGVAPDVGRYVVCVGVLSYRRGVIINEHRKDFIVNVTNCDFAGARLNPKGVSCDGFNVNFSNDDFSPLNHTFYWVFGDPKSGTSDTSTIQNPIHIYSDTGVYVYKLVVNRGDQCSDSAIQTIKVYPGFFPKFSVTGKCKNSPIKFTDLSTTNYGSVNSWTWKFGDPTTLADSSLLKNPTYTYSSAGNYPVSLSVTSTKGCNKTFFDTIKIVDKPTFSLTNDTLICSIDTLQLNAYGNGSVAWTPNYNIDNPASFSPKVSPKKTTTYYANFFESPGCTATDSVKVSVVNQVTLSIGNDTTICTTDTIQINTISDGLHYTWAPSISLSSDTAKRPFANPLTTTIYNVHASIGKCFADDQVKITTVPYPNAKAGNDTTLCLGKSIQLVASGGSEYAWSPINFLTNPNISNPVSSPSQSIRYIVKVTDVKGCPKPAFDTILIIIENLIADAGPRDTIIVVGQPLQLNATGDAESFTWRPSFGLSNANIANPVARLKENQQYILNIISKAGCTASDTIDVIVYKVKPDLYVPNAFTPNADGVNDIFRPILIGMKSLNYFKVYNRSGQLIYSTDRPGQGWDGTYKGAPQDQAVFVWTVEGEDYTGKLIFKKGSVTLVR
ncbi:MAG: PKD domain-containing protein [Ginsengibacter sp.]